MASNPPTPDLTEQTDEELLDTLRTLGVGRKELAGQIIAELNQRKLPLNQIADESGVPRTTVKRWAGKADTP
jgi:hypothetical protein